MAEIKEEPTKEELEGEELEEPLKVDEPEPIVIPPPSKIKYSNIEDDIKEIIKKDGSRAFTGEQSMGTNKLTNVVDPTANQDASTKKYVDDNVTGDQQIMIFYPDANPEVTSVDGNAASTIAEQTWTAIRNDGGASANDSSAATQIAYLQSHATVNRWNRMLRSLFLFDTSLIPDDATITSATFSVFGENKNSGFSDNSLFGLVLVASAPTSETEIVAGDYNSLGSVAFITTAIEYDDFSITGYNHFTLDADGLAAINKTGITKLGLMLECDFLNQEPTYEVAVAVALDAYYADKGRNQYSPKLVVTFTYA